jgi:hypothetical protein
MRATATRYPILLTQVLTTVLDGGGRPSMITGFLPGQTHSHQHTYCSTPGMSDNFTIFEGTSEIQRLIIGRAVTGLDVR